HKNNAHAYEQQAGKDRQAVLILVDEGLTYKGQKLMKVQRRGFTKEGVMRDFGEGQQTQTDGDRASREAPKPEGLIMRSHVGGNEGNPITNEQRDYSMGRGEKNADQFLGGAIWRRIEQNEQ